MCCKEGTVTDSEANEIEALQEDLQNLRGQWINATDSLLFIVHLCEGVLKDDSNRTEKYYRRLLRVIKQEALQ